MTVIVKLSGGPVQPVRLYVNVGVTVTVAVTGDVPLFIAVKAAIFPLPLPASPMPGVLFVQE